MEQFLLGFQVLWRIWSDPDFAAKAGAMLTGKAIAQTEAPRPQAAETAPSVTTMPKPVPTTVSTSLTRSDALSLLSVLQREGRLIDFLKEPISGFSDAEIGAAVRPIHKDCGSVIERMFGITPFSDKEEGQTLKVAAGYDPAQYRVIGDVPGTGSLRGKVAHPGWKATRCEVPVWNGRPESAMVLAPAEIEA